MTYDPFARGQYPVGVVTVQLDDRDRAGRPLEIEIWYPAAPSVRGQDLVRDTQDLYPVFGAHHVRQDAVRAAGPASGVFPLIAFSHGMAGHRRQSTFFCTHLASHGYVVVSPDHGGTTLSDLMMLAMRVGPEGVPSAVESFLTGYVDDRPSDIEAILRAVSTGTLGVPAAIDAQQIAVVGHSFGGFTALSVAGRHREVRAVIALAPAGGEGPLAADALTRALRLEYEGTVDTLYLALGRDTLLPLPGIEALYRRTPEPARMFVLPNADHMHFCDRAESSHEFLRNLPKVGALGELVRRLPPFSELVAAEHGYDFARALGLAHVDAALRQHAEAKRFLAQGAVESFAERGITIYGVPR